MFTQLLSYTGTAVAMVVLVAMAVSAILPDLWEALPQREPDTRHCSG